MYRLLDESNWSSVLPIQESPLDVIWRFYSPPLGGPIGIFPFSALTEAAPRPRSFAGCDTCRATYGVRGSSSPWKLGVTVWDRHWKNPGSGRAPSRRLRLISSSESLGPHLREWFLMGKSREIGHPIPIMPIDPSPFQCQSLHSAAETSSHEFPLGVLNIILHQLEVVISVSLPPCQGPPLIASVPEPPRHAPVPRH